MSARWPRSSQVTHFGRLWSRALHAVSAVWPSGVWVPRPALGARRADGGKGRACPQGPDSQVGRGEGRAWVQGGDVCGGPDCAPPPPGIVGDKVLHLDVLHEDVSLQYFIPALS